MANLEDAVKRLSSPDSFGSVCPVMRPEAHCANLLVKDARLRIEAATALRDNIEYYTNVQNYPAFLKRVMPAFINILRGPCIFQSNSPE